jgi:hypothetical protein
MNSGQNLVADGPWQRAKSLRSFAKPDTQRSIDERQPGTLMIRGPLS